MSETAAQVLARILREHGGRILVVGGGVSDLPERYQTHPALILWDDNKHGLNREVPDNVRAVLWNRWISHSTMGRLNTIIEKRRLLKFPALKTREIKLLLSEIVQEAPVDMKDDPTPVATATEQQAVDSGLLMKGDVKTVKGALQQFFAKNVRLDADYTVKGSKAAEARRLFALSKVQGVKTIQLSLENGLGQYLKKHNVPTFFYPSSTTPAANPAKVPVRPKKEAAPTGTRQKKAEDDFAELERLMQEAITAMKLVAEHLPNVRKETERLRGMRQKMLTMLGVEV